MFRITKYLRRTAQFGRNDRRPDVKTNIHITDWEGYEYSGWNVRPEGQDIQYSGTERDAGIELAPWMPVKDLNIEYYPYIDTELRVRYWDSEGTHYEEETIPGEQVVDKKPQLHIPAGY